MTKNKSQRKERSAIAKGGTRTRIPALCCCCSTVATLAQSLLIDTSRLPFAAEAMAPSALSGPRNRSLWLCLDGKAAADATATLWSERQQCQAALKTPREALAGNRLALQEALYGYKERLCRTGRHSEWAGFLRSMRIPLSTADRYVGAWKKRLADSAGVITEALEPTDEDIAKLTGKVARLIEAVVTSPTNMKRFSNSLRSALQASDPWMNPGSGATLQEVQDK